MRAFGMRVAQAASAVWLAVALLAPPAAADTITVGLDDLAMRAGDAIWIGHSSVIGADIAAGGGISVDRDSSLAGLYANKNVWVGRDVTVAGRVLANTTANADRGLNLTGDWTGSSVWFGREADATGNVIARTGQISIDRDGRIAGNVLGNHNIYLAQNTAVAGDVSPGVGRSLLRGSGVTIAGSTAPAPAAGDTFALPDVGPAPDRGVLGSSSIWKGNNTTTALEAGAYRDLGFGRHVALGLSAGTYTMKNFWMDREGRVTVDTTAGDVILNVHKNFSTGHSVVFDKVGDGDFVINVFGSEMWLEHDAVLNAQVRVWNGDFGAGHDSMLTGSIWAGDDISIDHGANVSLGARAVPEPGSLALIALGGVLMRQRRKWRPLPS